METLYLFAAEVTQLGAYQFIFNEVTHNLVVEVLDGRPLDALLNILFLGENQKTQRKNNSKRKVI